tara:strand:+ start:2405 stop:3043 length:639 start_codon:yes stop_codon:yes gene_type:complete
MSTVIAYTDLCNHTKLSELLNRFTPTKEIPCAYFFDDRDSPVRLNGQLPDGINPKPFPGNVTVCIVEPPINKYASAKIRKAKIYRNGKIHFAGGLHPVDAEIILRSIADTIQAKVRLVEIIMVNGVGHCGMPCDLGDLSKKVKWESMYNPDLHSALRVRIPNEGGKKMTTVLIQPTGAIQVMGADSVETVKNCYNDVIDVVSNNDYVNEGSD